MAAPRKAGTPTIADEANSIFNLVQEDQGKGFISDGLDIAENMDQLYDWVRGALFRTERAGRKMRKWLKDRDELQHGS